MCWIWPVVAMYLICLQGGRSHPEQDMWQNGIGENPAKLQNQSLFLILVLKKKLWEMQDVVSSHGTYTNLVHKLYWGKSMPLRIWNFVFFKKSQFWGLMSLTMIFRVEAESLRHLSAKYCPLLPPPRSTIAAAFSPDGKVLASTQ